MATLTQVTLTCDVCGKAKDVQTRTIGLDGKSYEIDLCPKDGKGLSKATSGYVSNARKICKAPRENTARQAPRENGRRPRSRTETAAIRDWARTSGMQISDRGRVPAAVFRDTRQLTSLDAPDPLRVAATVSATPDSARVTLGRREIARLSGSETDSGAPRRGSAGMTSLYCIQVSSGLSFDARRWTWFDAIAGAATVTLFVVGPVIRDPFCGLPSRRLPGQ